jgi:hypothetical protein
MKKRFIKDIVFFVISSVVALAVSVTAFLVLPWGKELTTVTFIAYSLGGTLTLMGILTLLLGFSTKSTDIKRRGTALLASGAIVILLFLLS